MAITFPSSPSPGDIFTSNGKSWQYVNGKWESYGETVAPDVFAVDAANDVVNVYGSLSAGASASVGTDLEVSGDLTVDTSTLHVDSTNNRVGIGTTAPSYPLEVDGSVLVEEGTLRINRASGTAAASAGNIIFQVNGSNWASIQQDSAGLLRITSSTVWLDGSAGVGIGTSSPAANLQVVSQNRAVSIIDSGVNNIAEVAFTSLGDDSPAFGRLSGYDVDIFSGTTRAGLASRLHVNRGGNVGIGTTAPAQELHVYTGAPNADVRVQGDPTGYMDMYHGTTVAGLYASNAVTMRFGTNALNRMLIDSDGRVTMPYQPSFKAILGTGQTYGGSGGTNLAFNNVLWNIGNHYNSSTGIFTAPVSGTYVVGASLVQSTTATGFIVLEWLVNGVKTPGGQTIPPNTSSSVSSIEGGVSTAGTVYLSANDTLQLIMYKSYTGNLGNGGGGVDWGEGRNFFSAALLG